MKMKRIAAIVLCVCMLLGQTAYAEGATEPEKFTKEKVHAVREASGDMESLMTVELSEDEVEKWFLEEDDNSANVCQNATAVQSAFMEYGSDYGYRDMAKRSHGLNRQYLYRKMKEACKTFTVNNVNAVLDENYGLYGAVRVKLDGRELTTDERTEVYFTFRNDNPQFFWLSNYVAWSQDSIVIVTYDAYGLGTERTKAFNEIIQTKQEVYDSKIKATDSEYRKTLKIHDALIADIEYPYEVYRETAHSIAGAMTSEKSAVCEGYAKVMQLMLNCYGIENVYITGIAGGPHAWNMVRMKDGKYYWLDATWDDQEAEVFQHDYFLVGNASVTDHVPSTPADVGVDFLYDLPAASDTDYVSDEVFMESINIAETAVINKGEMRKLTVEFKPANTTDDRTVKWSSSDPSVVTVDAQGTIKGVGAGQAVITAKTGEFQAMCKVTVYAPLQGIIPESKVIHTTKGQNGMVKYILDPIDTTDSKVVTFVSSNPDVVSIDELSGTWTAHKLGTAEITLKGVNNVNAVVTVKVLEYLKGDVNENGSVNIEDLRYILRAVCGKVELTERQIMLVDVVDDGNLDIQDLRKEMRYVCGKIEQL